MCHFENYNQNISYGFYYMKSLNYAIWLFKFYVIHISPAPILSYYTYKFSICSFNISFTGFSFGTNIPSKPVSREIILDVIKT